MLIDHVPQEVQSRLMELRVQLATKSSPAKEREVEIRKEMFRKEGLRNQNSAVPTKADPVAVPKVRNHASMPVEVKPRMKLYLAGHLQLNAEGQVESHDLRASHTPPSVPMRARVVTHREAERRVQAVNAAMIASGTPTLETVVREVSKVLKEWGLEDKISVVPDLPHFRITLKRTEREILVSPSHVITCLRTMHIFGIAVDPEPTVTPIVETPEQPRPSPKKAKANPKTVTKTAKGTKKTKKSVVAKKR